MHAFDRQTDGQTDRILIARPRLHSMQRGKKVNSFLKAAFKNSHTNCTHQLRLCILAHEKWNKRSKTYRSRTITVITLSAADDYPTNQMFDRDVHSYVICDCWQPVVSFLLLLRPINQQSLYYATQVS